MVFLGGLTVINHVSSWYTNCQVLSPYFQECCLRISVALNFKLIYYPDHQLTAIQNDFHYTRNSSFKSISKNPLFANFLPLIFTMNRQVLNDEEIQAYTEKNSVPRSNPKWFNRTNICHCNCLFAMRISTKC